MKKKLIITIGVVALIIIGSILISYNKIVSKEEAVKGQWANVESKYQRRGDLIPNLVNVVKAYSIHEHDVLVDVMEARSKATSVQFNFRDMEEYANRQRTLSRSLNRLLAITESYPELKADRHFSDLQIQLEGTENRISVERERYNHAVEAYNKVIRHFPTSIVAFVFSYEPKKYFESDTGMEKAPDVFFESK